MKPETERVPDVCAGADWYWPRAAFVLCLACGVGSCGGPGEQVGQGEADSLTSGVEFEPVRQDVGDWDPNVPPGTVERLPACGPGGVAEKGDLVILEGTDPEALACYRVVRGSVWVKGTNWTNLSPLRNLESVELVLRVEDNPGLMSLEGVGRLRTVMGGIFLRDNPLLEDLRGLEAIESLGGGLRIEAHASLRTLDGFQAQMGASLGLINNPSLESLEALAKVPPIGPRRTGNIDIAGNPKLRSLAGTEHLFFGDSQLAVSIGGDVLEDLAILRGVTRMRRAILWPKEVKDLSDLSALKSTSALVLGEMPHLRDLKGLEQLEYAGLLSIGLCGRPEVNEDNKELMPSFGTNENLESLAGLDSLNSVIDLRLVANPKLRDISALSKVGTRYQNADLAFEWADVYRNPSLPYAEIERVVKSRTRDFASCANLDDPQPEIPQCVVVFCYTDGGSFTMPR